MNFMTISHCRRLNTTKKSMQKGVVLIVALVMLLVMTAVGVTMMTGATLQERMAGNNSQLALARINAEAGLRLAEDAIDGLSTAFFEDFKDDFKNSDQGYYISVHQNSPYYIYNTTSQTDVIDLTIPANWTSANSIQGTMSSGDPRYRYTIEFIGQQKFTTTTNINIGAGAAISPESYAFKITSIGYGQNQKITAILQSFFTTTQGL
jgi:type IV pilus assembly protein PilX